MPNLTEVIMGIVVICVLLVAAVGVGVGVAMYENKRKM